MAFVKLQDGGIHEVDDTELLGLIEAGAEEVDNPASSMSSSDSTEIKKISSVNTKSDDVTDYQDASNAEQELVNYAEGELAQIQDPVQKSLAQQQFNLAIKQHTDRKNEIAKRVPDIKYKVAATSDDPDVLIKAYAEQQGLSPEDATLKFATSPAQLKASLRGANDMQYAGAHIKDAFTGPLRMLKAGGTMIPGQFDKMPLNLSDVGKNMSDSRGFVGGVANDPTIIPSLFIPGVGEAKLLSALGQGVVKGLAPEMAKQGLDFATGEQKNVKLMDLIISAGLGGLGGGIGNRRAVNQSAAGKNILGAGDAKLNDLIGWSEDATKAKIRNKQAETAKDIAKPSPNKNEILKDLTNNLKDARSKGALSYEDFNKYEKSINELKNRFSTITDDKTAISKEYEEWLSKNASSVARPKLLAEPVQHEELKGNSLNPEKNAAMEKMIETHVPDFSYGKEADKIYNLQYGGKAQPDIGRNMVQSAWALKNESPMGYNLSDLLMAGSERVAVSSPTNSSNNKKYKKPDISEEKQSLSDLIKRNKK